MRLAILLIAPWLPLAAMAAEPQPAPAADAAPVALQVERCEAPTGSRIRPPKGADCASARPGTRVYDREELRSTGQTDLGAALERLDTGVFRR